MVADALALGMTAASAVAAATAVGAARGAVRARDKVLTLDVRMEVQETDMSALQNEQRDTRDLLARLEGQMQGQASQLRASALALEAVQRRLDRVLELVTPGPPARGGG